MSKPPVDPKLPLPPTGDDPAARLFYPGSYFDRLTRRLGEALLSFSSQGNTPEIVAGAIDIGGATADKVIALRVNGTTYYFLASSTPP